VEDLSYDTVDKPSLKLSLTPKLPIVLDKKTARRRYGCQKGKVKVVAVANLRLP